MSSDNQLGSAAEYVTGMKEDESHDEEKNPDMDACVLRECDVCRTVDVTDVRVRS